MNLQEYDELVFEEKLLIDGAQKRIKDAEKKLRASDLAPKVGDVGILKSQNGNETEEVRVARVEIKEKYEWKPVIRHHYFAITYINRKKKNGDFSNRDEWTGAGKTIIINGKEYETI